MSSGVLDRVKAAFVTLARGADALIDYKAMYRAKLVRQTGDGARVDVVPTDDRLPPMSNIPLKTGLPGAVALVKPGGWVLVGWENGRPNRPFAALWDPGPGASGAGAVTLKLTLNAAVIELGGAGLLPVTDGVVRAETPCQFTGAPHLVSGGCSTTIMAKR